LGHLCPEYINAALCKLSPNVIDVWQLPNLYVLVLDNSVIGTQLSALHP